MSLQAKERLQEDKSIGGEEFFITDDTAITDPYDFLEPYLKAHGMKSSTYSIPYWLVISLLTILAFMVKLVKPMKKLSLPKHLDPTKVQFICKTFFFNRNKAILRLNYEPFYTPEESEKKALTYYNGLALK